MNDDTFRPAAADAEALSAYLAGDLGDAETAAFEQRLAAEPALAARLDALADALIVLGGHDEAEVPEGFDERLSARLAAERDEAPAPADLAAHRARRDRSKLWLGIGTAAAVIAVGSVMAGSMLRGMAGLDTASQEAAGGSGAESADLAGGADARDGSGPRAPVILDTQIALADEEALRRRYNGVPEAQGLIGVGVRDARSLGARFTRAVSRRTKVTVARAPVATSDDAASGGVGAGSGSGGAAPDAAGAPDPAAGDGTPDQQPVAEGAAPEEGAAAAPQAPAASAPQKARRASRGDPCLASITRQARGPIVPVRVESVRYAGQRAVAYVFVTATPGAEALDRTELWVVRQSNCATLVFQQY